jgi:predicted ribosomally synthesized peptide with SipW-like signal peptide
MSRSLKVALSVLIVGVLGAVAVVGSLAAFNAQTTSAGNRIQAGTVLLTTNSSGSAVYDITDARPGQAYERCVRVTYGGTLAATVKMYISSGAVSSGTRFTIQVQRGTNSGGSGFPNCGTFTPSGTVFATADLGTFPTTLAAAVDIKGSAFGPLVAPATESLDLRITVTPKDDGSTGGFDSGSHTFTWDAQST